MNTLWQTGHTLLCGSLRRMLFLLPCRMVVKYGVLVSCRQAGGSLARCPRFICNSEGHVRCEAVDQSTTNWAVLRECGHEPLQLYWFQSAVKLFNSMLNTNSDTLRRVVQTDLNLQPRSSACWTAQLLSAFQGLRGCELYVRAFQTGHAITTQEFTADLKHRMRGVWRDAELVDPNQHAQQHTGHLSFLVCHPFF